MKSEHSHKQTVVGKSCYHSDGRVELVRWTVTVKVVNTVMVKSCW